jgi:GGDEF domain-containing protein
VLAAAGAALVLLAGLADWATGPELSLLVFYFPGVALAAWGAGVAAGVAVSVLAAGTWLAADFLVGHTYAAEYVRYWNAGVRLAAFATVALLTERLRKASERERALRAVEGETGVTPGASFYQLAEAEFSRALRYGRPFTLAYLDAGTAAARDGAGEAQGAWVLEVLRANLRGSDVVARPRGREFALLLPETGSDAARTALGRIRDALLAVDAARAGGLALGAVVCAAPPMDLNRVIQRAYQLMYTAERVDGRVTIEVEDMCDPVPTSA